MAAHLLLCLLEICSRGRSGVGEMSIINEVYSFPWPTSRCCLRENLYKETNALSFEIKKWEAGRAASQPDRQTGMYDGTTKRRTDVRTQAGRRQTEKRLGSRNEP